MKFDAVSFFRSLAEKNKLAAANKFLPCTCSGIGYLQDVISNFSESDNFIAVDDTFDGQFNFNSGGFFNQESYTVFFLAKYEIDNMADRQAKLELCRKICRQFISRLVVLKMKYDENVTYLDVNHIFYRELGQYFLSGLTGIYIMVGNNEPTDLVYKSDEWQ